MRNFLFCVTLLMVITGSAAASSLDMWGLRAGLTDDSHYDQVFVGGHVLIAQPLAHIEFLPSGELGFGDDDNMLSLNADLFYNFTELETPDWQFKVGGGLALHLASSNELGLSAAGQILKKLGSGNQVFGEIRVGIEDSPDLKLAIGINFF